MNDTNTSTPVTSSSPFIAATTTSHSNTSSAESHVNNSKVFKPWAAFDSNCVMAVQPSPALHCEQLVTIQKLPSSSSSRVTTGLFLSIIATTEVYSSVTSLSPAQQWKQTHPLCSREPPGITLPFLVTILHV
jgi:hypothetical protein